MGHAQSLWSARFATLQRSVRFPWISFLSNSRKSHSAHSIVLLVLLKSSRVLQVARRSDRELSVSVSKFWPTLGRKEGCHVIPLSFLSLCLRSLAFGVLAALQIPSFSNFREMWHARRGMKINPQLLRLLRPLRHPPSLAILLQSGKERWMVRRRAARPSLILHAQVLHHLGR